MLISQRLEQLAYRYNDARRTVSLFLIEQANRFELLSMADVAAETYTSKATLVRIAKQLGFKGWRDFSVAYAREIDRRKRDAPETDASIPFSAGALPADIAAAIARVRIDSTWQTLERLDVRDLERASSLIMDARRIFLMGYGFNSPALDSFSRKLLQIGIAAIIPAQDNYAHVEKTVGEGDCLVIISYSGSSDTSNLMLYLEEARGHGARVIGVTSEGENYLRAQSDVTLSVYSAERLYTKIGTFSTEASIAFLLDAVYACIFSRDYDRNLKSKTEHSIITEGNRKGAERPVMGGSYISPREG